MTESPAPTALRPPAGYDGFVDERIRQTRWAVKASDLATAGVTLLVGLLLFLLVGAAVDHWLIKGGLDGVERYALWGVGAIAGLLYGATRVAPTALRGVNPLYAAQAIERESPNLKNSLLNALQLRDQLGDGAVGRAVQRQAAERLAAAGDAPIDHTPLLRAARWLLLAVAVIGVYVIASPKDFFASAGRVLAPWAQIAAPSRVQIVGVAPGSIEVAQGERVEVAATLSGLHEDDTAEIVFSTSDGREVDRRATLRSPSSGNAYAITLPTGSGPQAALGLQGDLTYRIEAGDARSPLFRITVTPAPTIAPVRVRYDYPAYSGVPPREVEGVGDLRALEGTKVTLTAEANLPIDAAQVDLGSDGRPDLRLAVEGQSATGSWTLRHATDAPGDSQTTYTLRFQSTDDRANHDPPQYRVEVVADLPPEAAILAPDEPELVVPADLPTEVRVEGRDPDFALRGLRLVGESDGRRVLERPLPIRDGRGRVTATAAVTPSELGLRPGDTLEYWVEAEDNRTPKPSATSSGRQRLRVAGPNETGAGQPQPGGRGEPQPGTEGDPADQPAGDQGSGQQGDPGDRPRGADGGDNQNGEPGEPQPADRPQGEQGRQQPSETDPQRETGEQGDSPQPPPGGLTGPGEQQEGAAETDDPAGGAEGESGDSSGGEPSGTGGQSGGDQKGSDGGSDDATQNGAGGRSQGGAKEGGTKEGGTKEGGTKEGGTKERPSDPNDGPGGDSEGAKPTPRDGSDDGAAFRRLEEFFQNQDRTGDQPADPRPSDRESADRGDKREGTQPADDQGAPQGDAPERDGAAEGAPTPRGGADGPEPDRPENGPGPGEGDRRGGQSDSSSSETGGETPPGQPSNGAKPPREGAGSSGQNQAADQGAGQSGDRGPGESSGRPGNQQQGATPPQGEGAGQRSGDGRTTDSGGNPQPNGDQPGGENGTGQNGTGQNGGDKGASKESEPPNGAAQPPSGEGRSAPPGDSSQPGDDPTAQPPQDQPLGDQRGRDPGGSSPGEFREGDPAALGDRGAADDSPGEGAEIGGDAANLDYARQQTELVLRRLEEELAGRDVDRALLDKLGWTEEDLRRFVARWRGGPASGDNPRSGAPSELDRKLRSLGLSPTGPTATRRTTDDQVRDLRDTPRVATPPRLRDALQRYNRSVGALSDPPPEGQ